MNDHELSPEARALVAIGRDGDEPTAADRERVRGRVLAGIAGGAVALSATLSASKASAAGQLGAGATSTAATAGSAGATGMLSAKLGAGVLAIALATAGGVVVMRAAQRTPPAHGQLERAGKRPADAAPAPQPELSAERSAAANGAASQAAPGAREREQAIEPVGEATVTLGDALEMHAAQPSVPEPRSETVRENVPAAPSPPADPVVTPAAAQPALRAVSKQGFSGTRVKRAAASSGPPRKLARAKGAAAAGSASLASRSEDRAEERDPTPSLRRELTLIAAAQAALARNAPEEALRWLDAHAAGYAAGELVEERLAARAVALCALGRDAEGMRASAELNRLAPSSPLLGRARRACAAREP